jgi:hypothetical protein
LGGHAVALGLKFGHFRFLSNLGENVNLAGENQRHDNGGCDNFKFGHFRFLFVSL